jgi:hypothetical protein
MNTYRVAFRTDDGEPATIYHIDADSPASALAQAAVLALKQDLDVATVQIEME